MIYLVAGARPNFMKIAPIVWEFQSRDYHDFRVIHTGQHYDYEMSQAFFMDLDLNEPDHFLDAGSGTHAEQTARVMTAFEGICLNHRPDLVVVVGDVNSTLAAALVAAKLHIPVAHIEAGLRSFDKTMPEEINRLLTDHVSDILFVTEQSGIMNLEREGIDMLKTHLVGNVMIDSLKNILERTGAIETPKGDYLLATIHRPANVDDIDNLKTILDILTASSERLPIVFPAHPRTLKKIQEFGLADLFTVKENPDEILGKPLKPGAISLIPPLAYIHFIAYLKNASGVITDSGGIQSETTYLGIPCLTLRETTEIIASVEIGTNTLAGINREKVIQAMDDISRGVYKKGDIPPLWDGETGRRIVDILIDSVGT
jgi:UDP-N-acetylglucosamine 2-epimerase (non-hydrolysing)